MTDGGPRGGGAERQAEQGVRGFEGEEGIRQGETGGVKKEGGI